MKHIFEIGELEHLLRTNPALALQHLLQTPRLGVDILRASLEGIAGPVWDKEREHFILRVAFAIPLVYDDGLPEPQQQKELQAACPGSVNDGGAANPPAAKTPSAHDPAESRSPGKSVRPNAHKYLRAKSVVPTAASSTTITPRT